MTNETKAKHHESLELIRELVGKLADCSARFKKCCIHSGSDEEYAEGAIAAYKDVITKATKHLGEK